MLGPPEVRVRAGLACSSPARRWLLGGGLCPRHKRAAMLIRPLEIAREFCSALARSQETEWPDESLTRPARP